MPVTQADRDAAADVAKSYREQKNGNWQDRIRKGECDDGALVQAFAAHREAALDEAAGVVRELADIARSTIDQTVDASYIDRIAQRVEYLKVKPLALKANPLALKANPHD